jgi:hypothetical protein
MKHFLIPAPQHSLFGCFFKAFDHGVPKGLILEQSMNCEKFQISYVLGGCQQITSKFFS